MHHGLRTDGRKIGLGAGACPDLDEGEVRVSRSDGLEGQGSDTSLTRDACDVRRARGGDGYQAISLISMDDGDRLSVTREQVSGVHIYQLEDSGVELELKGYGVEVAGIRRSNRHLEGGA